MMKILLLGLALFAITITAPAEFAPSAREGIEWCDIWISHANETGSPRVLLIGDSITRGYYPAVEKRLGGKAFVARLTTSAFFDRSHAQPTNRARAGQHQIRRDPVQ